MFAAVESAAIRARGDEIRLEHLPPEVRGEDESDGERYRAPASPDEERAEIVSALRTAGGIRSKAADMLGMSRTTLWR
ncbi:sigma-54-dependent Fis family transcriptional regulator, partial [Enterococcus hirae]